MNCKQGDLAVIVRTEPAGAFLLGRTVEVLERAPDSQHGPSWVVRLQRDIYNPINGEFGATGIAPDSHLRPLRNPGDDAQDETLAWKPVPLPAIQPELLERTC